MTASKEARRAIMARLGEDSIAASKISAKPDADKENCPLQNSKDNIKTGQLPVYSLPMHKFY